MLDCLLVILERLRDVEPIESMFGAVTYKTNNGFKGDVGMDHAGAVSQQAGKVVFFPGLSGLSHEARPHPLPLPD